jgi:hypothetical protein
MSTIFGLAQLSASDYQYARQADQALIYDAVKQYLAIANASMVASSIFVQAQTTRVKKRHQLTMTGYMQRRSEQSRVDAVARAGSYDVAYPLHDFGDEINSTDVDLAYMTPEEFQAHIDGALTRAASTYRKEVLTRLFKNTNNTVIDKRHGSLTIVPIANGDAVVYPPLIGSNTEAQATHFIAAGYVTGAISDTNNPIKQIVDKFVKRFGRRTGGIPVVVLVHTDERAALEALTNFVPFKPETVIPGSNTDQVVNNSGIPGEIIGTINGAWVSVWDYIPSGYMAAKHLGIPAPFMERIDPPETSLPSGLQLVLGPNAADFPKLFNTWRWRFGIGTRDRLNAVVLQLTAGAYSIPTIV